MTQAGPAAGVVEATGLVKQFGSLTALDRVQLRIEGGEAVVLFGPNGAGKTTLIRILTLGLKPGGGTIRIDGLDPARDDLDIRRRIGVISHQSYLYDELTAAENLEFFAKLYGVEDPRKRTLDLLESVDLAHRADDPVGTFSRGMQQRVSLVRSLVHDPSIVFLDEPFTGLDPHAAAMLRATLETLRQQRRTILLVTHNLAQGLELSDRWMILSRGKIVDDGRSADTDRASFEDSYFDRLGVRGRAGKPR